jgi:hypothetical protein
MFQSILIALLVVMSSKDCDGFNLYDSQLTENCGVSNPNLGLIHGGYSSPGKDTPW